MNIVLFSTILFIISCIAILSILYLFSWVIEVDNYSKPKRDIFSDGEAGDIVIERSNGMKEKIRKVYIKTSGKYVEMPNAEGVLGIGEDGDIIYSYVRKKKNKEEKNMREIKVGDIVKVFSDVGEDFDYEKTLGGIWTVEEIRLENSTNHKYAVLKEICDRPYLFNCELVDYKEYKNFVSKKKNKTEMTLEEVCKELGRDIKIVKEH